MVRVLLKWALSRVKGLRDVWWILEVTEERLKKGESPKGMISDLLLVAGMLRETLSGRYRLKNKTVLTLAAALLYFLIPTDALFDAVPFLGYVDDAAVLTYVLQTIADEVGRFKGEYVAGNSLE